MMKITKAIFPVAGLGTRFLPATKANPKEMLPIVDKPLIQYAVEEAVHAGITELIFVTNSSKRAIEDHFDSNFELEATLQERGKKELLDIVKGILPEGVSCAYIRQKSPQGLGHAVLCAKQLVMNEPFAVLLADDLIDGGPQSCLAQMVACFKDLQTSIVAVEQIHPSETGKYGIVDTGASTDQMARLSGIIEKPHPEQAPSNLGVVGRYILTPRIFSQLENTKRGSNGEIQLTDAIAKLLQEEPVYAYRFQGKRYDCGSKLGYLEATVAYALKHPELAGDFKRSLESLVA
ncbi:UTP--glucose-1-phosphate uridylyltransferase [Aquicella siphonis]|uniref:UTP--glucose-1-phosphate uridylyltransferase n=1 Tax=Aquicella siphonis TaxID=254247 RepID=A0A5E4PHF4_9COXI|nr:UTP--glucose-1-phosphate uridylyltransferase GalU [Aquicella siphonis]VVC76460.1 UTP--glucose-1-phosphate uridylyltransferase [Aquicella siphonis]